MSAAEDGARPTRQCTVCWQEDDHPRHTWAPQTVDGQLVQVSAHLDCCAAQGCPDHSCDAILSSAGDKRGLELTEHLTSGGADEAIAIWRAEQQLSRTSVQGG